VCVALALAELGRVDLDETHALPVHEPDRVAVDDLRDRLNGSGRVRVGAPRHDGE
jgi:hypothetical protein